MAQEVTPEKKQGAEAVEQTLKKREKALSEKEAELKKMEAQLLPLKEREKALSEKEAELKKMEAQLLPLKEEINTRMAELNDLQNSLAAEAKKLAEKEKAMQDAKITHLVKLYSSMEAGKAAAILDKLNIETVVRILGNMRGKSAGAILAMMTPNKGAIISERLSGTE